MQKKLLIGLLLGSVTIFYAQVGGRNTYQFLNLVSSPRQAALGGKVITNYDYDVTQPLYNPATINDEMDNHLALNYVSYLADISYGSAAYAYTWDRRILTFHAGVTYINYGSFDGRDENGRPTGSFTGNEVAISFGYALNIIGTDFYVGTNVKFITSQLAEYNSLGGAMDFGGFYKNDDLDLNIALVVRNVGTQFTTYAGVRESLPLEVDAGISQKLANVPVRWHFTMENLQNWNVAFSNPNRSEFDLSGNEIPESTGFFQEFVRHMILGVELLPDRGFNIRLGYSFRRAEELRIEERRNFAGLSAGFAVKLNKLRFSYTYARYSAAANSSFFGLMINW